MPLMAYRGFKSACFPTLALTPMCAAPRSDRSFLTRLALCSAWLFMGNLSPLLAHSGSGSGFVGVDTNGNGISDVFEALFPGAVVAAEDTDFDGMSNLEEMVAGTDPTRAASRLEFGSIASAAGMITGQWLAVRGKSYKMQGSASLDGGWADEGTSVIGTGGTMSLSCPMIGARRFFRLVASDLDTDGDGVSDWEEGLLGTDPAVFDTDGDGKSDLVIARGLIASSNHVSVFAQRKWASEVGPVTSSFLIVRSGGFGALTIPLGFSGTATFGADYTSTHSGTLTLPTGVRSAIVTVTPVVDAVAEAQETIVLTLGAGAGYTVDTASATVTILSQGVAGQYFDTASSTYSNAANFDPAQLKLSRQDGAVDYDWGSGVPVPQLTNDHVYSIRWTGYLVFPVTDSYTLSAYCDRGLRVWVNTAAIDATTAPKLDYWTTTNKTTKVSSTAVGSRTAGVFYNFKVEYRDDATFSNDAMIRLMWSRAGAPGVETVIPVSAMTTENFLPASAIPVINSLPVAVGVSGAPFLFNLSATNSPTSFGATGLPSGLVLDTATGAITGTMNVPAGWYFPTISASNANGTDARTLPLLVVGTGGLLTREMWTGVAAAPAGVETVPIWTAPTSTSTITTFEAPADAGDSYGERIRGFITPAVSGNYTFFLSSDENAELWVSANAEPARRLKRSWVRGSAVTPGAWETLPTQKSLQMKLAAGDKVYVETVRRETTGSDHLAIAWRKPTDAANSTPEIIPSWALSPWSTPGAGPDGTLYIATLTPQGGTTTNGSGTGVLRVSADQTQADLTFTYAGLTGAITQKHLHDQRSVPGPATAILFDLDSHPADSQGVYHWTFAPTGNHTVADEIAAITSGNLYLNLHTAAYPSGEIKGYFYPAIGSQFFTPPATPAAWTTPTITDGEAVRFLEQASFGARYDTDGAADVNGAFDADSIEEVKRLGYAGWIDAQFALAPPDPNIVTNFVFPNPEPPDMADETDLAAYSLMKTPRPIGNGPIATFVKDYYTLWPQFGGVGAVSESNDIAIRGWWKQTMTSPQQLRHRLTHALGQIIVVSQQGILDSNAKAVAQFYDALFYASGGNFREVLKTMTLNVGMGRYLDMFRNQKPSGTRIPNENYGREIMQLFSVGLQRVHPDGTLVLDSLGDIVPTYSQNEVVGLAHVFTGWSHADDNASFNSGNTTNYVLPMKAFGAKHSTLEKALLDNTVIPAISGTATDQQTIDGLEAAHDLLFHHPNVAPFICRQLIQRMVTSNPSPGYVYRVVQAFNNNGSGVRGDMQAVTKAVLLDYEARATAPRGVTGQGCLREPLLRLVSIIRGFRGYSRAETYPAGHQLPYAFVAASTNVNLAAALPVIAVGQPGAGKTNLDGIRLYAGCRLLLLAQTAAAQNGLYLFPGDGQLLVRDVSADTAAEISDQYVEIAFGTKAQSSQHSSTITTLGTDVLTWTAATNPRRPLYNGTFGTTDPISQSPLSPPTVFNFYEPNYAFSGYTGAAGLNGPEFQILSESALVNQANLYYDLVGEPPTTTGTGKKGIASEDLRLEFNYRPTGVPGPYPWPLPDGDATNALNNPEVAIAHDTSALLDRVNTLMLGGSMSTSLRTLILGHLNSLQLRTNTTANNLYDRAQRVRDAVYLTALSHEFATLR